MDQNTLTEKLKWCKRELLALKTAHERGLGTSSFYTATDSMVFTATSYADNYLKITATLPDGLDYTPYCQCYLSSAQYFQPFKVVFDEDNHKMVFWYMSYLLNVSIDVAVKIISAVPVESITMEGTTP